MRKLAAVLFVAGVLSAATASAQETYAVAANASQVTELTRYVTDRNQTTCERLGLAEACTQAQACTAASAPGGAACSAAQARGVDARIYPLTQAGREEFTIFRLVLPQFNELRAQAAARDRAKQCQWWATANTTQRNVACATFGRPNECELCP